MFGIKRLTGERENRPTIATNFVLYILKSHFGYPKGITHFDCYQLCSNIYL